MATDRKSPSSPNMLGLLGIGTTFGIAGLLYLLFTLPDGTVLKRQYPVLRYLPDTKNFKVSWSKSKPENWVNLEDVSPDARRAIMISEDWAFYDHYGIDENQIVSVFEESMRRGRIRGASTISQQVVKNLFLTSARTPLRKIREVFLTFQIEAHAGKNKILETYLNIAEWGEGVYGIHPAAWLYFRKSPASLTVREGAFLAMLLPSPKRYSQSFRDKRLTNYAEKVVSDILLKLNQAGYLSDTGLQEAHLEKFWWELDASQRQATKLTPRPKRLPAQKRLGPTRPRS